MPPVLTPQQLRASRTKAHYAAKPEDWEWVARRLAKSRDLGEAVGLDTEFHGKDLREFSPAGGSVRVHVWSVAWLGGAMGPRGFRPGVGCTLPVAALACPALRRELEDERLTKAVHNLPVDFHSLANEGVSLRGAVNTLSFARWVWPERKNSGDGFDLKGLMPMVGRSPLGDFTDLFSEPDVQYKTKVVHTRVCECGTPKCRKRTGGHVRREETTEVQEEWVPTKKGTPARRVVPLQSIVPGHWLWPVLVPYAQEDSEAALDVWTLAQKVGVTKRREIPWM